MPDSAAWSKQDELADGDIRVSVMVTRARDGFVECARLQQGEIIDVAISFISGRYEVHRF